MFDPEFYPSPPHVIHTMGIDCYDKVVFEPSAGKGDIVDYCTGAGAALIYACEQNPDLAQIVSKKAQLIAHDFFTVTAEQVSNVQLIVMNPPFSNAGRHILHAWQIAPEGCEIIALCNYATVENQRGYGRSELSSLIGNYGESLNLGDCFSKDAERKTGVEVGLVKLFKPVLSSNFDWDGLYLTDEFEVGENSLMKYNEIRAIVNTYVAAVKCFDEVQAVGIRLNTLCGTSVLQVCFNRDQNLVTKDQFSREFQARQWKKVFSKFNIEKFLTKNVIKKVTALSESRKNYPFTMKNIYRVIEIIIGTAEGNLNESIVEAVDNFTRHTHENRYGVEGWKTNAGHLLNRKFIINNIARGEYSGKRSINTYNSYQVDYLMDLFKALCFITGTDYNEIPTAYTQTELDANTWYDWGFFEFKLFKKGTGHFKFKNEDDWARLNQAYAKIKGQVLPEVVRRKAA